MGGAQSSTASKRDSGAGAGAADKRARPSAAKNIPAGQQQQDTELDEEQQQQQQLELARLRQRLLRPATLLPRPLQPEHEKDHALVLDLMEFFCFAVKVCAQHLLFFGVSSNQIVNTRLGNTMEQRIGCLFRPLRACVGDFSACSFSVFVLERAGSC